MYVDDGYGVILGTFYYYLGVITIHCAVVSNKLEICLQNEKCVAEMRRALCY